MTQTLAARTLNALVLILLAVAFATLHTRLAQAAPQQVYEYKILHPKYGEIGSYTNMVVESAAGVRVQTRVEVLVRALGIVVYRQNAERVELWHDGRLVSFRGVTVTNGKAVEISGEAHGDVFVVHRPDETEVAPANVLPSNPWSLPSSPWATKVTRADMMMSTVSGRLFPAQIRGTAETDVVLDGNARRLHQYEIDSDKREYVWLDGRGVPVAFRTTERGAAIDMVLVRQSGASSLVSAILP